MRAQPATASAILEVVPPLPNIGISTSAYADLPLEAALARIAGLAPAAEIRSFGAHSVLHRRCRRAALEAGLAYTVHGPFGSNGLGDVSRQSRRDALHEHRRHLEASAEIGATIYVVHPDWHRPGGPRQAATAAMLELSFAELRELQDQVGVEIVVENMPGAEHSHFTHPGDLDLRGLGLLLDAGHAAVSGCLDAWLADPCAPLRHVHLHSNGGPGDGDRHLALGAGVVDAAAVLAAARAAGASVVLEHDNSDAVLESLAYLRSLGLP